MVPVKRLYDLQELDWKIAAVEKSLVAVRLSLADDSAIVSARELVDLLDARLEELTTRRRASDRTLSETQEKLQRLESRLYGGAITNPKELSAAQDEREFILGQQRQQEDELLELMVAIEEAEPDQKEAQEALEKLLASQPREEAELIEREERFTGELSEMREDREQRAPLLPSGALSTYESLRKSKNGQAVARVERGMCQGCRVTLSTMQLQRARNAQGLVQCSSCRRILYLV